MKDALGSLAQEHAEGLVVNSIRKVLDNGQLAMVKSGKLQPVHVTSRFYSFTAKKIQFPTQSEDDVREMLKRRVFWLSKVTKAQRWNGRSVRLPVRELYPGKDAGTGKQLVDRD